MKFWATCIDDNYIFFLFNALLGPPKMNSTGAEMLERAHAPNQGEYIDVIEHRKGQGEYIDVIEYRKGKPTPTITDVKGNHRRCINFFTSITI